jgi:hypothetical protein
MTVSVNGTNGIVFNDASTQATAATGFGFKNRIINGAMMIDQRNAGASVTPTDAYTLDRWEAREDTDGAASVQQVSDAPTGFINSLKVTTTTADASLGATQRLVIGQFIEGLNCSDLAFGSASASTVTLSFQVKSSLTGTFGGALANSARNRSYPFTYTINSANTWETKTVTIAGDTSGTWLTTNGVGLRVYFGLGVGSTYSGTAGAWAGAEYYSATGATSVIGTLSATWQVTGVQLEKGSTATSFDYRPYGTELALCQRYYCKGGNGSPGIFSSASRARYSVILPVAMRATPTTTAIADPVVFNPTVAEQQTGSQTTNFSVTGFGENVNYSVSQIQFGGFTSGADGRPTTLLNTALQFSAEL